MCYILCSVDTDEGSSTSLLIDSSLFLLLLFPFTCTISSVNFFCHTSFMLLKISLNGIPEVLTFPFFLFSLFIGRMRKGGGSQARWELNCIVMPVTLLLYETFICRCWHGNTTRKCWFHFCWKIGLREQFSPAYLPIPETKTMNFHLRIHSHPSACSLDVNFLQVLEIRNCKSSSEKGNIFSW